jgi:hypothetical protein
MDLGRPFTVVTPTVDGDVLAVLAGATASFTASEVHQLLGRRSEQGVRRSLRRLVDQGIVVSTRAGRTWTHELNRSHLASEHIIGIAQLRAAFMERARSAVGTWEVRPELVALFGSAATGHMRADSDIDVCVVRPVSVDVDDGTWREQLYQFERDIRSWTGNTARILELGDDEIGTETGAGRRPVVAEVERDGIVIVGQLSDLSGVGTS